MSQELPTSNTDNVTSTDRQATGAQPDNTPVGGAPGSNSSGGVTQIVAGTGVTISPTTGVGVVTVNAPAVGTVTSLTSGSGITLSPSTITTTGSISGKLATTTTQGDVIVPTSGNLAVDGSGNISVPAATASVLGVVKPDGTIITNTAGAITVAKASASVFGVVEVDNTTITASAGVISAVHNGTVTSIATTAPITGGTITSTGTIAVSNATSSTVGVVKPDNSTITISSGILTAVGSAILPLTTLGDTLYENSTPTPARLAGSITKRRKWYTQTGTGSVSAAPAWTAFPVFNVADYGTVQDGSTDDGPAINLAIADLNTATGGTLYFPGGAHAYFIATQLTTITALCAVVGDTAMASQLSFKSTLNANAGIVIDQHTYTYASCYMRDLYIYTAGTLGSGITYTSGSSGSAPNFSADRIIIWGSWQYGFHLTGPNDTQGLLNACNVVGNGGGSNWTIMKAAYLLNNYGGMVLLGCQAIEAVAAVQLTGFTEGVTVDSGIFANVGFGVYAADNSVTAANTWVLDTFCKAYIKAIVIGNLANQANQCVIDNAYYFQGNTTSVTGYKAAGAPGGTHNNGDFYLNTSNGDIYWQQSGSWGSAIANIVNQYPPWANAGAALGIGVEIMGTDNSVHSIKQIRGSGSPAYFYQGLVVDNSADFIGSDLYINGCNQYAVNIGSSGTATYTTIIDLCFNDIIGNPSVLDNGTNSAILGRRALGSNTDPNWNNRKELKAADSWNPGTILIAGQATLTFTITGAAFGDQCLVGNPYDLQQVTATAYVSSANTVTILLTNSTAGNVTLGSGTWWVRVIN